MERWYRDSGERGSHDPTEKKLSVFLPGDITIGPNGAVKSAERNYGTLRPRGDGTDGDIHREFELSRSALGLFLY